MSGRPEWLKVQGLSVPRLADIPVVASYLSPRGQSRLLCLGRGNVAPADVVITLVIHLACNYFLERILVSGALSLMWALLTGYEFVSITNFI